MIYFLSTDYILDTEVVAVGTQIITNTLSTVLILELK